MKRCFEISSAERLTELADILAAGLIRKTGLKSSPKSPEIGEISLDFSGDQSGHPAPLAGREHHG
jgi:hypothetical protein